MKDFCIYFVVFLMVAFDGWYVFQICRRKVAPTLSTWIIFSTSTILSLGTYAIAENHDFRSGILNMMDAVSCLIVVIMTIKFGKREVHFKSFEKWYLGGAGAIVAYGFFSGNAWNSNIFTQILICVGYIPMIHNIIVQKKNTESFLAWGAGIVAGVVALYPAMVDGNFLAVVYATRTIVLVSFFMFLMAYYEFCGTNRKIKEVRL